MRLKRLGNMEIYGCGGSGKSTSLDREEKPLTKPSVPSGAEGQCGLSCRVGFAAESRQISDEVNRTSSYHGYRRNVLGGDEHVDDYDDYDDGSSRSPSPTDPCSLLLPPTATTFTAASSHNSRNAASGSSSSSNSRKVRSHLHLLTFITLVLLTQLTVNISIGK